MMHITTGRWTTALVTAMTIHVVVIILIQLHAQSLEHPADIDEATTSIDVNISAGTGSAINEVQSQSSEEVLELSSEEVLELSSEEVQTVSPEVQSVIEEQLTTEITPIEVESAIEPPPQSIQEINPFTVAKAVDVPTQPSVSVSSQPKRKVVLSARGTRQGNNIPNTEGPGSLERYLKSIVATLQQNKRFPENARNLKRAVALVVHFIIDRSGNLISSQIKQSSGSGVLDAEGQQLIQRTAPFPPFPSNVSFPDIEIVLPLSFALQ